MTIFATILEKLGLPIFATPTAIGAPPSIPKSTATTEFAPQTFTKSGTGAPVAPAPQPPVMPTVDVMSKLNKLAAEKPSLNWKSSIIDLLRLLGIDSTLDARKTLAIELGCPPDLMTGDYTKMNIWLHKAVLQKIAEYGGNLPKELLH